MYIVRILSRMGILEGCFSLGAIAGTFLSSYVFNAVGYIGIFGICAVVSFIAILFTWFLIPESLPEVEREVLHLIILINQIP